MTRIDSGDAFSAVPVGRLQTPALLLDTGRMYRNIERVRVVADRLGVRLRPHLKTAKSTKVAAEMLGAIPGPATVSTISEIGYFASMGVKDILYGVGIAPDKLERILDFRRRGIDVSVVVDSIDQAEAVVKAGRDAENIPVFIEIDIDGHRGGIRPDNKLLLEVAEALHHPGAELRGVLAHAGEAYSLRDTDGLTKAADWERAGAVDAADRIRRAGYTVKEVSVGSTPTVLSLTSAIGLTEIRAGVYVFFDLVMAGIGVCRIEDIAISVLGTVIGHQAERGWILIDAGWTALSADRGTADQEIDQGYGVVCDIMGKPYDDLVVIAANQEHGIISRRPGSRGALPTLPVGTRIRILPNHACATAAQYDGYHVLSDDNRSVVDWWPRIRGW